MRHSFHYTSNAELSTQSERMSINLRCDLPHYSGRIYVYYKHSIHANAYGRVCVCVMYALSVGERDAPDLLEMRAAHYKYFIRLCVKGVFFVLAERQICAVPHKCKHTEIDITCRYTDIHIYAYGACKKNTNHKRLLAIRTTFMQRARVCDIFLLILYFCFYNIEYTFV